MDTKEESFEALIVDQGFEYIIEDFTMDDFRGERLPNFPEPENLQYRRYYRIEKCAPKSWCPWGRSRWVTGENGKLEKFDDYYDSSG